MRAGASVIDVTGGMFGVIGILAALERRHRTGKGGEVKCSLYETTAFLVGQHMAQKAVTGQAARPMPVRISAWAIYDVFETKDGSQVFVGVVSDQQWAAFCAAFGLDDLGSDESLARNNARVQARETIMPRVRALFAGFERDALLAKLEDVGLPFAPIARPEDLFEDAHLNAGGGLVELTLADGTRAKLPALPVEIDGVRPGVTKDLTRPGEDGEAVLRGLGLGDDEVARLRASGAVG